MLENHPDKIKWNERHSSDPYPDIPAPILLESTELLRGGKALDVACGTGRNTRFLLERGYRVTCVDISDVAIESVKNLQGVDARCVDLDSYCLEKETFDCIVNIHYLERRLFPYFKESLRSGGILFFETFVEDEDTPPTRPSNRDHLLRSNELLHAFIGMQILSYTEKKILKYNKEPALLASLIARKW